MDTTRRQFLVDTTLGVAALQMMSCGSAQAHLLPDSPRPPASSTVGMVRASRFSTHKAAVRTAVALAGGLSFIAPGDRVLLKPALNSGNRYPATADPETMMVVAAMVTELGGVPFIAERTRFLGNTETAFKRTGIWDAAHDAQVDLQSLDFSATALAHHRLATHWPGHRIPVYRAVLEADHIINFCTPRTHALGDFTMSLKNHVGVVSSVARTAMHTPLGFKERVAEIVLVTMPALVVMDGRDGFTNGGPDEGDLAHLDFVAVGRDPVAVDALGLAQLRLAGTNDTIAGGLVWSLPILSRAVAVGAGVGSAAAIQVVGLPDDEVARLKEQLV